MKEASITLPLGHPEVADWLEHKLAEQFGGVTVIPGVGSWYSPTHDLVREDIQRFVVAVPEGTASDHSIETDAQIAGLKADQQAMYITTSGGDAKILDIWPANQNTTEAA